MFVSFDCMIQNYDFAFFGGSIQFFKIALSGLIPLLLIITFVIGWSCLAVFKPCRKTLVRNIAVSIIATMFFLHPTLTSLSFSLFKCYYFEEGVNWVYQDMSLKCWGKEHLKFVLMVGVPMLIVWVAGLPLLGFTLLCCNWKKLHEPKFMSKYVILYIGLWEKRFYWEFVNTLWKITILSLSLAIPIDKGVVKALACVIFLYLLSWL